MPQWELAKPTLHQCISDLIKLVAGNFSEEKFKSSIKKSFLSTGTMYSGDYKFTPYRRHAGFGTMKVDATALPDAEFELSEDEIIDGTR